MVDASNAIEVAEKQMVGVSENMLMGVKIKFGKDSNQYEMARGKRRNDFTLLPHSRITFIQSAPL